MIEPAMWWQGFLNGMGVGVIAGVVFCCVFALFLMALGGRAPRRREEGE